MNDKISVMIDKAYRAMRNAYAPYSNFTVGACLRTPDDQLFVGCNIENVSFGLTQCAEATALGNLISSGHRRIAEMVIVTKSEEICPPCGACRQRFIEFCEPETLMHLCSHRKYVKSYTMAELLPLPFSFIKHKERG